MFKDFFQIIGRDNKSQARCGIINTPHGKIMTPAFVPVGTAASVKSLIPEEIRECLIDVFFVNTYHMMFRPGIAVVKKNKGLHKFMNWTFPIMTDSAGFQAFSLSDMGPRNNPEESDKYVKITDDGITFKSVWDGQKAFLGPKESIQYQLDLKSDILMAFDECTFYPITKKRAQKAMFRTHRWALSCIKHFQNNVTNQHLYGIVQGSVFKDLRQQSAKFLSLLPFDGIAIGSVANSREPRKKVFAVLDWTMPILLPLAKPLHFLGIGEIEDIFLSVEKGIDSLDCITPTRLARMGWIFSKEAGLKNKFRYDITKKAYSMDKNSLEKNCRCYTCENYTRSYIHHLFKSRELLCYRLATIHNLFFFGRLMNNIRDAIYKGKFITLKRKWLK